MLPDSTKVWLNAESSLKWYPAKFGKGSRDVFLTGEAYFDVTKRGKKHFAVNTSKIRILVYGTRFNVKAYPEDATIETTLEEGKIELTKIKNGAVVSRSKPVILQPDQRAVLVKNEGRLLLSDVITTEPGDEEGGKEISVKSGKILVADKVDTEVYTSWKDGRLIIRGEPLEHLAKKLERRYDVHIIFKDNTSRSLRFTGILENETLEQVLFAIQLTSPIRYTIDHKNVYLEKIR
jgi:ferric-dicitrate binding protein FerR (iron transport regulator)